MVRPLLVGVPQSEQHCLCKRPGHELNPNGEPVGGEPCGHRHRGTFRTRRGRFKLKELVNDFTTPAVDDSRRGPYVFIGKCSDVLADEINKTALPLQRCKK